ncbi:MAG: hypothetical protein QMD80_08745, partial [archaeon]|nr:hypothetical protein [archaeon]
IPKWMLFITSINTSPLSVPVCPHAVYININVFENCSYTLFVLQREEDTHADKVYRKLARGLNHLFRY